MIDALFTQPNYLSAKKGLDLAVLREEAIHQNIANLETPGYKRMDVASSFVKALEHATATRDPQAIASVRPQLAEDPNAVPTGPDGNTVNVETELLEMNKNNVVHALQAQLVTSSLIRLKLAINGKAT